jgi:hypothetical protein
MLVSRRARNETRALSLMSPPRVNSGTTKQKDRSKAAFRIHIMRPPTLWTSLQDLILECHAFGIIFLEPSFRGVDIYKHFEMLGVADRFAC